MEKLKRFSIVVCTFLLIIIASFSYGCKDKQEAKFLIKNGDEVQTIVVDLSTKEFSNLEAITVLDVLNSNKYKDVFKADIVDGTYVYLNGIAGLTCDDAKGEFVALYTSLVEFKLDGYDIVIDGQTYYSSMVGIKELIVKANETYIFSLESFSF